MNFLGWTTQNQVALSLSHTQSPMDITGKMGKQVINQHPFAHSAGSSILEAQVEHS